MKCKWVLVTACAMALSACQTAPNIKQLQDEKLMLQNQLNQANTQIDSLKAQEKLLQNDIAELNRVVAVLGSEKSSRVQESTTVRGEVRKFIQKQIDTLKEFLVLGNLLDYIGGELVERSGLDEKPLLLVDLAHPIPKGGTLTGVGAYFSSPSSMTVKVLRPVEQNLVVIWESKPVAVEQAGLNKINFPVSVGVEEGDVLAYFFPEFTTVSFDTGTGDTRYALNDINLGGVLSVESLGGKNQRRAYSIGVYGLLN